MRGRTVTAVDIGSDAIKVVRLRKRGEQVELLAAGWLPLSEVGRLESSDEKSRLVASRLKELVRSERAASADCVVGISGRSTMMRYVQVPPAPPWKLDMLMKYEAAEQTPGGEECAYDYQILNIIEFAGQLVVAMAIAQESALEEHIRLGHAAGAADVDVEISSIGLMAAYRYGQGATEGETSMVVDLGAEEVKLVIQRSGEIYFARSMPGGSRRFISAIETALGVPFNEAERLFQEGATIEVDDASEMPERERKVRDACLHEANQLANSLQSSVMFCRAQTKLRNLRLDRVHITGGGSKLPGLAGYLSKRMNLPVEELAPFRNVSLARVRQDKLAEIDSDRQRFSTAVGLGLSRLHEKAFTYKLMPDRLKRRNRFLSRGIYVWYAAAVFLVALGLMVYTPIRNHTALAEQLQQEQSVIEADGLRRAEFNNILEDHKRLKTEVSSLMQRAYSGQDLLRCLSQLKKVTPDSTVLLTAVTTITPESLRQRRGRTARAEEETFQKYRSLYILGCARSKVSHKDSIDIVQAYADRLNEIDQLFDGVEVIELEFQENKEGDHWLKPFTLEALIREGAM